jgi:purine-binding chemotaxis protein CheW
MSVDADTKKILHERAELLAREPADAQAASEQLEIVEFLLGNERYGLAAEHVREIDPLRDFTPVPCTPPFVLGLINVRGQILTVLDIRKFFDLPQKGITNANKVLILRTPEMEVGILADEILGMRWIPLHDLQPSLPTLTGIRAEYLRGVTSDRLVVLDAARILSDKRIIVRDEVEA